MDHKTMIALLLLALAASAQTAMNAAPAPAYASHLTGQQSIAYDR